MQIESMRCQNQRPSTCPRLMRSRPFAHLNEKFKKKNRERVKEIKEDMVRTLDFRSERLNIEDEKGICGTTDFFTNHDMTSKHNDKYQKISKSSKIQHPWKSISTIFQHECKGQSTKNSNRISFPACLSANINNPLLRLHKKTDNETNFINILASCLTNIRIFLVCAIVSAKVFEQCELPDYKGIVIHKYYNKKCPHCQRIAPLIEEIGNRLEEHGLNSRVRSVECSKCRCYGIDAVPTVVVTRDNTELGRIRGYRDYPELAQFFSSTLKLKPEILKRSPADEPSNVAKLKETDFNKPFIGPWLILFYTSRFDKHRELLLELNKFFQGRMRFGEAKAKDMPVVTHRFGIEVFPTLVGMYNGVHVWYKGEPDLSAMVEWCENFIAPVFTEIDRAAFDSYASETPTGEPLYVVFHQNTHLANKTFADMAHKLRARTKFFKTSDTELLNKAAIKLETEDSLVLAVSRNSMFHKYEGDLTDNDSIMEWIYHTHYPLLTKISTFTFSGIFFGFKPVLLLISNNDYLFSEFEKYSEKAHANLPFTQFIHAAVNHDEFATVLNKSLKHLSIPAILIYDPMRKAFFGENMLVTKENLTYISTKLCTQYMDNQIKRYGIKSYKKQYFAMIVFFIGLLAFGFQRTTKTVKIQ